MDHVEPHLFSDIQEMYYLCFPNVSSKNKNYREMGLLKKKKSTGIMNNLIQDILLEMSGVMV